MSSIIRKICKQRNVLVMMMVVVIMSINTLPVLAAEVERSDEVIATSQYEEDGVHVLEINWDDLEILDTDVSPDGSGIEPYSYKYDFVNDAGITSSDVSIPFNVDMPSIGNVYFILNCKYMDGTTGTATGKMAHYSGTVKIDGITRTIGSGITLAPGPWTVEIVGVKKQMSYSVKVYAMR